jgi:Protein of unknown function (DUF2845)
VRHLFPLLMLLSLSWPLLPSANATETRSFRCKNDLVKLGDAPSTVRIQCGEPVAKDSFCRPYVPPPGADTPHGHAKTAQSPRGPGGARGCDTAEEWTYNPGRGQFWTILRFEEGRLTQIRYGNRIP